MTMHSLRRHRTRWAVTAGAAAVSCGGEEPPALEIAGVAFAADQLLGLTPSRVEALAELTAFGAAVAHGRLERLGEPLVDRQRGERLGNLLRAKLALADEGVTDEALRARYLTEPELTVRHLIVFSARYETDQTRGLARAKASAARDRILGGEPFPDVAAEVSDEPGAESRQGLLEPGREGAWVSEFWTAAAALDVGEISQVVETQYGFHVLRLENYAAVPYEEARNEVLLEAMELMGAVGETGPVIDAPPDLAVAKEAVATVEDATAADATPVASWGDGELSLGELRDHLAALTRVRYQAAIDESRDLGSEAMVSEVVRWKLTQLAAAERGLHPGPAFEAAIVREWVDAATAWAETLEFRAGLSPDALAEAALTALTATGQNATLARNAIRDRSPLIRRGYPMRGDGGSAG